MLKQYIEYREMQQLRKDHLAKQKRKQALILIAIFGALILVMGVIGMAKPAEPVTQTPAAAVSNHQREIEKFADVVTKPVDTLSSEDLDFIGSKAGDPCYEKNAMLPREEMISAITACSS